MWRVGHQEWDYVVLIEERADNDGMSVTNNATAIANAVYLMTLPIGTDLARVAFYERYPYTMPEQADRISFGIACVAGSITGYMAPEWTYGTLADLVELLGVPLVEER